MMKENFVISSWVLGAPAKMLGAPSNTQLLINICPFIYTIRSYFGLHRHNSPLGC